MNDQLNGSDYGYVYLMKAQGFHGILSPLLGRYKIGLTNNPSRRLAELNSEQAPCPIVGIRYIQVEDNLAVEQELHRKFKSDRRYGEWFDFWIWQMPLVHVAYGRKAKGTLLSNMPVGVIKFVAIASLGFTVALGSFAVTTMLRYNPSPDYAPKTNNVKR